MEYQPRLAVLIFMRCERSKAEKVFKSVGINARFHAGDLPASYGSFTQEIHPIPAVDDYFDALDYGDYSDFDASKYCKRREMKTLLDTPFALAACYASLEQIEQVSKCFKTEGWLQPRVWYWHQWLNADCAGRFIIHPSIR